MDTVIKGGTVVTAQGARRADVGIAGERIAAIGPDLAAPQVIDAGGCYVVPGGIDAHVHLQMPVGPVVSSDDFFTGTVAAACGGTTTVIDFVEPAPGQRLGDALAARRAEADGRVAVDYGLHMTLADGRPQVLAQVSEVMAAGATTFKLYMAYEGLRLDDAGMLAAYAALREHGGLPIVHAENHDAIAYLTQQHLSLGHTAPRFHPLTRPAYMEGEATGRAIALARVAGVPVYIVHVSCAEAVARIRQARQAGQPVLGDTCPQYVLLTEREYDRPGFEGAKFVVSPPLRTDSDQEALWAALADGTLAAVVTDHCPFNFRGQKELGRQAFNRIPGGAPGVEARLALLHTYGVRAGRLSLSRWVEVCATAPARLFGLPQKGEIRVGADADLVVFDPQRQLTLSRDVLHERVDYTPYEGLALTGYPVLTLLRGRVVCRDGAFVGQPGAGRYLVRERPQLCARSGS